MIKLTWLPEDLHHAYEREIDTLVDNQEFLEHFFALTKLLEASNRRMNADVEAS